MKVVLLSLSGDLDLARRRLRELYPEDELAEMRRAEVEGAGFKSRLERLRALKPDVLAVFTERLAWQRGQTALALFGALGGAKTVLLFDSHGGMREESRADVLVRAPLRMAREAGLSASAVARSRRRLRELERAVVEDGAARQSSKRTAKVNAGDESLSITYLRATPGAGTQFGGASSHINGFINAALKQGARIHLISNDRIAGLDEARTSLTVIEPEPVGTTRAAFDLHNNLVFTRGAVQEIEKSPPDFIYQRYSRFTWAGIEASLATSRPLFLEYNGSEVWVGRHWDAAGMFPLLERVERLNLLAAARIFVVSEVERRNLLRAGLPDEKIVVNPNGVDTEKFRPGVGGWQIRKELGIAEDEILAGFVGTFGPWHGVMELAHAISLVPYDARLKFLLIGAGKLREEVERVVREAGVRDRVHFAGVVEHERVPAYLDACDMLVSPHIPLEDGSEFFGSPTKLFEYMAMGKGIVASRLGQIGDVLKTEETALLVEPGNVNQLSEALLRLTRSKELRERLGRAARSQAVEHHTWAHNARRVLDAYRSWAEEELKRRRKLTG
ncbi:MAG: glycosyltransferase family 4 protein [Pyrinomonadaceae bacterium]|nr:glycosyltransferase family 4 protein [Pyrinomonadaceae bacterium]